MLDFFKTLFANATERIKNPLIGTFLMSWIVFNWKAILVLLFSSLDIEKRLSYLAEHFNNIGNLLIYPLIVALGYIFLLPYINLWIDKLLSDSNLKHHKIIQRKTLFAIEADKEVEIAKIGLEEAKADYRDRAKQNKLINDLEGAISSLESSSNYEKDLLNTKISELNDQIIQLKKELTEKNMVINRIDINNKGNRDGKYDLSIYKEGLERLTDIESSDFTKKTGRSTKGNKTSF